MSKKWTVCVRIWNEYYVEGLEFDTVEEAEEWVLDNIEEVENIGLTGDGGNDIQYSETYYDDDEDYCDEEHYDD